MSSQCWRYALEKQLPEGTSLNQVEEQEDTELHVAASYDVVDEPLASKRLDPVATPCVAETSGPGKD